MRYYYCGVKYKRWVQTGYEQGDEKFSLEKMQCGFIMYNALDYFVRSLQNWIIGGDTQGTAEDVQEVSKIEFYYLDVQDVDDKEFCSLSYLNQAAMIKQYGVEVSPQEYEALKKELYLID